MVRSSITRARRPRSSGCGCRHRLAGLASAAGCSASSRQAAARSGATIVHLETNRALTEAIALYRSAGYREVPAFNDEPFADHWFEKQLPR